MGLQNFIDNSLPTIKAAWLNQIDAFYTTLFSSATTPALARTALAVSGQLQEATHFTAGGAADAMTGTLNPALTSYTAGLRVSCIPNLANATTTPTLNIDALGAKTVKKRSSTGAKIALSIGDYNPSGPFNFEYDGTDFILLDELRPLRTDSSGTFGALQVAGVDVMRFGSDVSGQLAGFRNIIINGNFNVNQMSYVSGAAVGTALYGHDMWKMEASGDTYTYSTTNNSTLVTIPAGKVLRQIVAGSSIKTGTYTLSWAGTAQGKIGAGSLSASGVTGSLTGGTSVTIEFGPGTVQEVQLERGTLASPFELRPYATELLMCQRYLEKMGGESGGAAGALSVTQYALTGNGFTVPLFYQVTKAVAPVVTKVGTWAVTATGQPTVSNPGITCCRLTSVCGGVSGQCTFATADATTYILIDARP